MDVFCMRDGPESLEARRQGVVGPKDVQVVNPWMVKATLHWQRDFAHITKLRILRWRRLSWISRWASCNHKGPSKREPGRSVRKKT